MNRGNGRAIQRRTSRVIESHLQIVGWISRQKTSRLPAEGEAFLLTSPFIEPPISKCDGSSRPTPFSFGLSAINLERAGWQIGPRDRSGSQLAQKLFFAQNPHSVGTRND